ncbi:MAG: iron-containing alcohol dehydrogenase family protein [Bryobacteraceae bacterium]|nr:iron-containing alcohol dehydrogenase family protein [Bryobacteraceae bacterium]
MRRSMIRIPELVRIKPGALDRVGLYLRRPGFGRAALMFSEGLPEALPRRLRETLAVHDIEAAAEYEIADASFEEASALLGGLPPGCEAIVGLGGGKALDTAKYAATLANLPYFAVPTSLSNDGFCSPQSSLTLGGKRRSLAAHLPWAVVIDTEVCLQAPAALWASGVGDLAAKLTATADWKLSFHATGEPVDDFATLLSDATVFQFAGRPERDHEGIRLLGTALMLNGIAMEMAGSSRPASGAEHLISHALDRVAVRPRLHGLQVGCAAYLVAHLQGGMHAALIGRILDGAGFWALLRTDPFLVDEWRAAFELALSIKPGYYTVLSTRDCWPETRERIASDPYLAHCFTGSAR